MPLGGMTAIKRYAIKAEGMTVCNHPRIWGIGRMTMNFLGNCKSMRYSYKGLRPRLGQYTTTCDCPVEQKHREAIRHAQVHYTENSMSPDCGI